MSAWDSGIFKWVGIRKYFPVNDPKKAHSGEPKKIILSESLATTVRHCLVHLPSILTSTAILIINIHGLYMGINVSGPLKSDTLNLMLLQLAAKAHEIMIVASLSIIVLQTVRHELLFGDGLPLGLIGSGLAFSNIGFFFDKEFYGALKYLSYNGSKARKFGFLGLLILSGFTAVLVGPASAVLLVPKAQPYPVGGTQFFLNGSANDFWPEDLSGDISELQHYCSSGNSTNLGICPAGGFLSIWDRWNTMNYTNFISQNMPSYAKDLAGSRFYWPIHSPASQIPPLYALGDPRSDNETLQPYTWLVQAHAAPSIILQRIATDWWELVASHMGVNPLLIDDRNIKASVRSVISSVRCANPQNMSASEKMVQFPTIEGRWNWAKNTHFTVNSLSPTAVNHLRFQWVHLPDTFGAASIGAVFETPWVSDNTSRVVVGCSAQTGWVPTEIFTDSYTFWSGWYPYGVQFGDRTPSWTAVSEGEKLQPTNGRIALGNDWLNLLTPPAPALDMQTGNWQASTIESILGNVGVGDITNAWNGSTLTEDWLNSDLFISGGKTRLLEAIVSNILADGLSRSGSHRVFDTTGPTSDWSLAMYKPRADFTKRILNGRTAFETPNVPLSNVTSIHASMQITGFAYRVTLAGFLSMLVLMTHMFMVLTHTCWVVYHKRTSSSWNSVSELIALSQNSQPALDALKNTGAGIHHRDTFARVAKIRIKPQPKTPHVEHVELVFEDLAGSTDTAVVDGSTTSGRASTISILSGQRMDYRGRGSWTFPLSPDKIHPHTDFEHESLSSLRARLAPKAHVLEEDNLEVVRVNQKYS